MRRTILLLLLILGIVVFSAGQTTQTTKNTVDQTLRSSGRVNPSTHAMEFDLPFGGYSGRGVNLPLGLSYSSKVWRFEDYQSFLPLGSSPARSLVDGIYSEDAAAGWTSSLAQPYVEYTGMTKRFGANGKPYNLGSTDAVVTPITYVYRVTVFLPGGESHELRRSDAPAPAPTPGRGEPEGWPPHSWDGTFTATDGSGIKFVQDTNDPNPNNHIFRVYIPDGSFYDFNAGDLESHGWNNNASLIRRAKKLTDANGNFVQFNEAAYGYPYGSWTDQLGRIFPVMIPLEPFYGVTAEFENSFVFPGMDQNHPYVLKWKKMEAVTDETLRYIGPLWAPSPTPTQTLFDNQDMYPTNSCGYSVAPQNPSPNISSSI